MSGFSPGTFGVLCPARIQDREHRADYSNFGALVSSPWLVSWGDSVRLVTGPVIDSGYWVLADDGGRQGLVYIEGMLYTAVSMSGPARTCLIKD